jgi:hypothetical protein
MGNKNLCTITGLKAEAMRETWKRIREMEKKGIPTLGKWGSTYKEVWKELKERAFKECKLE